MIIKLKHDREVLWGDQVPYGTQAQIWSVPRYGELCHRDIVEFSPAESGDENPIVRVVTPSGYSTYEVYGPMSSIEQAMAINWHGAEIDLQIEVWSQTINNRDHRQSPLHAGLALAPGFCPLEAMLRLRLVAARVGIALASPTLSKAAGDEVGAARDRRLLRAWGVARAA